MKTSDKFMIVGSALTVLTLGFLGYRKMLDRRRNEYKEDEKEHQEIEVTNETSVELGKTENVDDVRKHNPKRVFKKIILTITNNTNGYFYNLTTLEQFMREAKYQLVMSDFGLSAKVIASFPKTEDEMKILLKKTRTTKRVFQFLVDNKQRLEYCEECDDSLQRVRERKRVITFERKEVKPDYIFKV